MSDGREDFEELNPPEPRYEHYHLGQKEPDLDDGSGKQDKPENRPNSFVRKLIATIALAVVFGVVAGGVFWGMKAAADRYAGDDKDTVRIGSTDTITEYTSKGTRETASGKGSVAEVAEATMPAVVAITTVSIKEIPSFFGYATYQKRSSESGSGIIVGENEEELFIATNNHVVEDSSTLSVCFIGDDVENAEEESLNLVTGDGDLNLEDAVTAKIKGTDEMNDLAVVTVKKADIPEDTLSQIKVAKLGSSDSLTVGEQVVAIGNALGYGQSVTSGWVSALNRNISTEDGSGTDLIQTDAAINPGNSGGALLNMQGELIGINSAKYADYAVEGMGYAIPISKAQPILENIMNRKTREIVDEEKAAYMGIRLRNRSQEVIQMYDMPIGAFISGVVPGAAADEAGIREGDIVETLDGLQVSSEKDLLEKLQHYEAGETVEVCVARFTDEGYAETTLDVTFDFRPQ
ncbi:MAG: trypsin-like peptidase domain-containing protein [Eubacteriales bacterium]|nr:trypsin-like peptidase domain-containing protein [Eubacteriales bacterium]